MSVRLALLILAGAAASLTGCRSVPRPNFDSAGDQHGITISPGNKAMAEALANYGMGVLREGIHDAGAVSNYLRAVELEPGLSAIYLRVAVQHIRRGERDNAVAIMEEACRSNPRSIEAPLLLSQIYQVLNEPDHARQAAQRAIEIDPGNNKGYLQLSSVCISGHDFKGAVMVLRKALDKADDKLPILRMLGDVHAQQIPSSTFPSPDIREAISCYAKAITYPTDNLSMVYLQRLGDLYLIDHQVKKALACFQKMALHDPDNTQIQQKLALCYVALGNRQKALEVIKAISAGESPGPDLYYYLGELYDSLGDREHTIENFKAARDAEPENPKWYLKLAVILMRDNPQKAKEVLQEGLDRMPKERLLLEVLAQIYMNNRQYHEALALFERMYASALPNDLIFQDPRFYANFGTAAQQCRLYAKAIALYSKAIEINPAALDARVRLAMLYLWLQNADEALSLMEEAVSLAPDDTATWFFYAMINNRAARYADAVPAFDITEQLAQRLPDRGAAALDSQFYFNYGAASERNGEFARAEKLMLKSIALDSDNSDAFNYLAYMWADKGINLDLALEYVSHALDFEPDNSAYLDTLGWVLFKKGQLDDALDYIRNAQAFTPDDSIILEHLGDVFDKMGQSGQALLKWKQSFIADGSNTAVAKKLRDRGVVVDELRKQCRPVAPPDTPPE